MPKAEPDERCDAATLRAAWLARLERLITEFEALAKQLDWSTRRIEKKLDESRLGSYSAPALLLQKEAARLILDPIASAAPGADGVVDLYLMPAYDNIATLFYVGDSWRIHYEFSDSQTSVQSIADDSLPLSLEILQRVFDELLKHAA